MSRHLLPTELCDEALRLRESGMVLTEIARRLPCALGSLSTMLRRAREERVLAQAEDAVPLQIADWPADMRFDTDPAAARPEPRMSAVSWRWVPRAMDQYSGNLEV